METELKFQVPAARRAGLRSAVATRTALRTRLQAVYVDTDDDRLAAAGLALRLRKEGRLWVQTLKGRGDGLLQRQEHELPLPAQRGEPPLDPARHAGTAVGERLLQLLQAQPGGPAALVALYRTDIQRLHRTVSHAGARIELALDEGWIIAAGQRLPVFEIEFELKSGPQSALLALAERWAQRFGLVWDVRTKSERGFRLARGLVQVPAVRAPAVAWPPAAAADAPAKGPGKGRADGKKGKSGRTAAAPAAPATPTTGQAWSALLGSALAQVLPNAAELAEPALGPAGPAGQTDAQAAAQAAAQAEHLHQLRVGLRRLRTVLAWCAEWGPEPAAALALQAAWREPFTRLGAVRDGDVLSGSLWPEMQAAGAPPWRTGATVGPAAAADTAATADKAALSASAFDLAPLVRDPAFTRLLLHSLALALPPVAAAHQADQPDPGSPALPQAAAGLLQARWLQVRQPARRFETLALQEQHRTRRRLKRLRYLVEGLLELGLDLGWERHKLKRWHRSLTRALDALGHYNDLCMAEEALVARLAPSGGPGAEAAAAGTAAPLAADEPAAWFARGWLSVKRPAARAAAARGLQALVKTPLPWPRPR